jgi:hypothetical protein
LPARLENRPPIYWAGIAGEGNTSEGNTGEGLAKGLAVKDNTGVVGIDGVATNEDMV